MRWSLISGISIVALLAALSTSAPAGAQDLRLDADLDLVVEMPLAVADALDAGVPRDELVLLTGSLVDGGVSPADFIEVVTLTPVVYDVELVDLDGRVGEVDRDRAVAVRIPDRDRTRDGRRAAADRGLGAYVQRQLDRGLRGRELARAIHRELNRRGIPAGAEGRPARVRGGDRVALDRGDLRELRERRERRIRGRDGDRVPPGQLEKRGKGKGKGTPPGHAKGRGRGHDKGHGQGPPPHAGDGPGKGRGHGDGGER